MLVFIIKHISITISPVERHNKYRTNLIFSISSLSKEIFTKIHTIPITIISNETTTFILLSLFFIKLTIPPPMHIYPIFSC